MCAPTSISGRTATDPARHLGPTISLGVLLGAKHRAQVHPRSCWSKQFLGERHCPHPGDGIASSFAFDRYEFVAAGTGKSRSQAR
jgi:hypothetical protein